MFFSRISLKDIFWSLFISDSFLAGMPFESLSKFFTRNLSWCFEISPETRFMILTQIPLGIFPEVLTKNSPEILQGISTRTFSRIHCGIFPRKFYNRYFPGTLSINFTRKFSNGFLPMIPFSEISPVA